MSLICNVSQAQLLLCFSYTRPYPYLPLPLPPFAPVFMLSHAFENYEKIMAKIRVWSIHVGNVDEKKDGEADAEHPLIIICRQRVPLSTKLKKKAHTQCRAFLIVLTLWWLGGKGKCSGLGVTGLSFSLLVLFTYLPSAFA